MARWIERFCTTTRGRILGLLRRGGRTVNELADALELTDNAVRAQLSALERDGLVRQAGARPGVRRPHAAYELTPEAEPFFPKAYGALLQHLLGVLATRLPPGELDQVLRAAGSRLAAGRLPPPGTAFEGRLKHALELTREMGGLPEVERRGGGTLFIRGHACPLAAAVVAHPQACRIEEAFLAELLGTPVRTCCDRHDSDRPQCLFEVSPAAPVA